MAHPLATQFPEARRPRSQRVGYIVCRGVGVAAAGTETAAVRNLIGDQITDSEAKEDIIELPWNAENVLPSRWASQDSTYSVEDRSTFSRDYWIRLGKAWRECIYLGYPSPDELPIAKRPTYRRFLNIVGLVELSLPLYFAGIAALLAGVVGSFFCDGRNLSLWPNSFWLLVGVALLISSALGGLLIPLFALVSIRESVFFASFRSWFLASTWPFIGTVFGLFSVRLPSALLKAGFLGTGVAGAIVAVWRLGSLGAGPDLVWGADRKLRADFTATFVGFLCGLAFFGGLVILGRGLIRFGKAIYRKLSDEVAWPVTKTIADVLLFLGDRKYRGALMKCALVSILRQWRSGYRELRLLGHSLGSVILVDALAELSSYRTRAEISVRGFEMRLEFQGDMPWTQNSKIAIPVLFVTAGSPLRRFINRFFPGIRLDPTSLDNHFRNYWDGFRWLNIYRKNDPIGTALRIQEDIPIETSRFQSWLSAHLDYFSDRSAREAILRALKIKPVPRFMPSTMPPPEPVRVKKHAWSEWHVRAFVITMLAPIAILFLRGVSAWNDATSYRSELLRHESVEVPGVLWKVVERVTTPAIPDIGLASRDETVTAYYVQYKASSGRLVRVEWDPADTFRHDMKKLNYAIETSGRPLNTIGGRFEEPPRIIDVVLHVCSRYPKLFEVVGYTEATNILQQDRLSSRIFGDLVFLVMFVFVGAWLGRFLAALLEPFSGT